MKFRDRNLRELAGMVCGDAKYFVYRSSSQITRFFEDCDLEYRHDGSTRWAWVRDRLSELLSEPSPNAHVLPGSFVRVFRVLMDPRDPAEGDEDRSLALEALNVPFKREGFEAYFDERRILHFKHVATATIAEVESPHRPFTPTEIKRRE